jgi:hypothetical protein
LDIAGRWIIASVIEGGLGLGIGVLTLVPIVSGPHQLFMVSMLMVITIFLTIMAATVAFAHSFIMRPVIRYWKSWSIIDGGELFVNWIIVVLLITLSGFFHGLIAIASVISGTFTALFQYILLRSDTPYAWRWVAASVVSWAIAGSIATYVEMMLPTVIIGVVWSVGLGRMLYGLVSGPFLAWVLTRNTENR